MYTLDVVEKQLLNDFINYCTIIQSELFYQWSGNETKAFMFRCLWIYIIRIWQRKWTNLWCRERNWLKKPLHNSKTKEEKNEEISTLNVLSMGDIGLAAKIIPSTTIHSDRYLWNRAQKGTDPHLYDEKFSPLSKICRTPNLAGASLFKAK